MVGEPRNARSAHLTQRGPDSFPYRVEPKAARVATAAIQSEQVWSILFHFCVSYIYALLVNDGSNAMSRRGRCELAETSCAALGCTEFLADLSPLPASRVLIELQARAFHAR